MTIDPVELAQLRIACDFVLNRYPHMPLVYQHGGYDHERYRWDVLLMSGIDLDTLYGSMDTASINAALKTIMGSEYV